MKQNPEISITLKDGKILAKVTGSPEQVATMVAAAIRDGDQKLREVFRLLDNCEEIRLMADRCSCGKFSKSECEMICNSEPTTSSPLYKYVEETPQPPDAPDWPLLPDCDHSFVYTTEPSPRGPYDVCRCVRCGGYYFGRIDR